MIYAALAFAVAVLIPWGAVIGYVKPAATSIDWSKIGKAAEPAKPDARSAITLVRSLEDWFTASGMSTTDARTLLDPVADKIGSK